MSLREKIYDQVWDIYQEYKVLYNKESDALQFKLFPIEIAQYYGTLHELLIEYRMTQEFSMMDVASFIADLHMNKTLEKLLGLKIVKNDLCVHFMNESEFIRNREYLVEIDSQNGIRRFQPISNDKEIYLLVNSQKEQLKILVDYLMLDPERANDTYFFLIGEADGFPPGYQIGLGKLYHFQQLPKLVKESWRHWKTFSKYGKIEKNEGGKGYVLVFPENKLPDEEADYREKWFIKITIKSFGSFSAERKAISTINRIASIIRLFCGTPEHYLPFYEEGKLNSLWDYYSNNNPDVDLNEKSEVPIEQLGAVNFVNTKDFLLNFTRITEHDNYISIINKIIEKDENKRTDLETAIINAIDIYGTINANTHLNLMLCMIALESLVMGGKQENIAYKLAERTALLIGDSEEWLQYCLFFGKIDSIYDSNSLPTARIILNKTISELYNKRSEFAHTGEKRNGISYNDYLLAHRILRWVLMKVMVLYNSEIGLLSREPDKRTPNRSIEEYIKGLKFGKKI